MGNYLICNIKKKIEQLEYTNQINIELINNNDRKIFYLSKELEKIKKHIVSLPIINNGNEIKKYYYNKF